MNEDFIEPCFCFDEASLVDKIRQKVKSIQSDPILEEITYFLEGSVKYLENNIPQEVASELFSAIFTFFKQFTKELMPIFDVILKKSRTNANYIYITSSLLSYLTHEDLNLDIPDYHSFINDTINEICQQITNQSRKLIIFGHEIASQFQNDLILNTALSLKLTESISPKLYNHIFYHYWQKNDKRFDLFLLNIITSGLITVLPQTESSNEEILEFLSKKDDQIFLKMSTESFSIIKSAIIYIKYESNVQVKGLDERTIFQFATVISVLLPLLKDFSPKIPSYRLFKFVNEIPIDLFTNAAN